MSGRPPIQKALININHLTNGVYDALMHDDIPRATQLSWHLMQHPECSVQLQAQAVLINSSASLALGGDRGAILKNVRPFSSKRFSPSLNCQLVFVLIQLQAMLDRMRSDNAMKPPRAKDLPTVNRCLQRLEIAVAWLRVPPQMYHWRGNYTSSRPSNQSQSCLDLDALTEGLSKIALGSSNDGRVPTTIQEEDEDSDEVPQHYGVRRHGRA